LGIPATGVDLQSALVLSQRPRLQRGGRWGVVCARGVPQRRGGAARCKVGARAMDRAPARLRAQAHRHRAAVSQEGIRAGPGPCASCGGHAQHVRDSALRCPPHRRRAPRARSAHQPRL